ncbi:MAG: hypothetical protein QM796_15295 [Chthoniobacteraceae bacterium]
MKVHLQQIPLEGLTLSGEEPSDFLEINDEAIRAVGLLTYELHVGLSDGGLFATGSLAQDFDMECVSCLRRFTFPLRMPQFAMQMELEGRELVDLTPQVREDIVLALPPHPRCDWNGESICPGTQTRTEDSSPAKPDTWAALDQLKLKPTK